MPAKKKTTKEVPFRQFLKEKFNHNYGTGEIPRFTPQIQKALKIIAKKHISNYEVEDDMEALGFECYRSSGVAFVGRSQVIKLMYDSRSYLKNFIPKKYRVPTVHLKNAMYSADDYKLVIQPTCKRPKSSAAMDRIYEEMDKKTSCIDSIDVHSGNVGLYKNRPVLFDW